jgi:N-methylhydantoinase A
MGCVIADMRQDFVQTINSADGGSRHRRRWGVMQRHVDEGLALLDAAKSSSRRARRSFELDMAYVGQTHTVAVPLPVWGGGRHASRRRPWRRSTPPSTPPTSATYGRLLKNGTRRVMNLRTAVIGRRPKFDLGTLAPVGGSVEAARSGSRKVHFGDAWHETAIYDRLALPVGAEIDGPAILVQPDTTVLIDPGLVGARRRLRQHDDRTTGGGLT